MSTAVPLLQGLHVVDLASWIAGPAATTVLSDFGADVIKVEPPGIGDTYLWGTNIRADHLDRAGRRQAGEGGAVPGVVVVDQGPRPDPLRRRLAQLLGDPGVGGGAGDAEVDDPTGTIG